MKVRMSASAAKRMNSSSFAIENEQGKPGVSHKSRRSRLMRSRAQRQCGICKPPSTDLYSVSRDPRPPHTVSDERGDEAAHGLAALRSMPRLMTG